MSFQKSISLVLILSQVGMASSMAAATPAQTASPELVMLENIVAMQGQKLSTDALKAQTQSVINQYLATAKSEGQEQRLEQAFVDLGIYTPAQAQSYVADAQKAAMQAGTQQQMIGAMEQLAANHPAGAQFSMDGWTACMVGDTVAILGAVTMIVGSAEYSDNPTCSTPEESGLAFNPKTGTWDTVIIPTGPTTCTRQNYYPHRQAGTNEMIAGGVLFAVGGVFALVNYFENGCND